MQSSVANKTASNLPATLRLGTRTSKLALWQTHHVVAQLQQHWPHLQCELVHHVTQGDKRLDRPLPEIGGKGLFTAELEEALLQGEIDLAVHSLKDLPVEDPEDLTIGAILSREDTRDVLVAGQPWTLATLPQGAIVGTSSLRRQAHLLAIRPDLDVRSIRGNVDTRLRKVLSGEYHAAIMAGAGLTRLGLTDHITEWISPETMLCAPGQGALAVQCRTQDAGVRTLLSAIHDEACASATSAERHLLFVLGGGCSAPVGAWAVVSDGEIRLAARVIATDGRQSFNATATGRDPHQVAEAAAASLLAQGAAMALSRQVRSGATRLAGKQIVVTRPQQDSNELRNDDARDELTVALERAGATPIVAPVIKLVPVKDNTALHAAIEKRNTYDWLIFTSANAVEHFYSQLHDTANAQAQDQPKIAAVGPATQAALLTHGVEASAMPHRYLGTEIVDELGDIHGKRILLPRSAQGGRDLPAMLRERGATVDEIFLYDPVPVPLDKEVLERLASGVDLVTFASGSAVRAFVTALSSDGRFVDFWKRVNVACIGPSTAAAAREAGLPVQIVADEHTAQGLVAAIIAHFEQET